MSDLYKRYIDWCEKEENGSIKKEFQCSKQHFSKIFGDKNLALNPPSLDHCDICRSWEVKARRNEVLPEDTKRQLEHEKEVAGSFHEYQNDRSDPLKITAGQDAMKQVHIPYVVNPPPEFERVLCPVITNNTESFDQIFFKLTSTWAIATR